VAEELTFAFRFSCAIFGFLLFIRYICGTKTPMIRVPTSHDNKQQARGQGQMGCGIRTTIESKKYRQPKGKNKER